MAKKVLSKYKGKLNKVQKYIFFWKAGKKKQVVRDNVTLCESFLRKTFDISKGDFHDISAMAWKLHTVLFPDLVQIWMKLLEAMAFNFIIMRPLANGCYEDCVSIFKNNGEKWLSSALARPGLENPYPYKCITCIPRWNDVEATVPRRFNVEYIGVFVGIQTK